MNRETDPVPARPGFYERFWSDAEYQLRYASWSASHDRLPAIQTVWGGLRRPGRVLDFGCGNGVLTHWLYANGFAETIIGVDISATGIRFAQEGFARPGLEYVRYEKLEDLGRLGKFDAVVASHVLEHLTEVEETLAVLRGLGEWFVFEVPLESCLAQKVRHAITGKAWASNPVGHVNFWNRTTFEALLARLGYIVVRGHLYASAPYCPFIGRTKRFLRRAMLAVLGTRGYCSLMAAHYAVLARAYPGPKGADLDRPGGGGR